MCDPANPFETWLLHRVAEAVEGAEVSAELLTELHAAMAEARAQPLEARESLALMDLAERVNLPVDELTDLLATLDAQPPVITTAMRPLRLAGPRLTRAMAWGSVRGKR